MNLNQKFVAPQYPGTVFTVIATVIRGRETYVRGISTCGRVTVSMPSADVLPYAPAPISHFY